MQISVCILTKNSACSIQKTLESLVDFDEVLLLDNGSSDATLQIAEKFSNVKIHHSPFIGFGPLKNRAAELAKNSWILSLDSDEVLSKKLLEQLKNLELVTPYTYLFPRHNYFKGKHIQGCGWGSQWTARLYHKEHARFSLAQVHEKLVGEKALKIDAPIFHTPFESIEEFLHKIELYGDLFAKQNRGKKKSSFTKALIKSFFSFIRSFLFKRGFFYGSRGLLISWYNANSTFYKYIRLKEENEKL